MRYSVTNMRRAKKYFRKAGRKITRRTADEPKHNPVTGWISSLLFVFVIYILFKAFGA
jgi:hypothetical protein